MGTSYHDITTSISWCYNPYDSKNITKKNGIIAVGTHCDY
jgi:hypothetical protein